MKIEEEIHQTTFKSENQKAAVNILYTANNMNIKSFHILKEFGLTIHSLIYFAFYVDSIPIALQSTRS
jgi:hypothetical protein